jgi:hypothetical protein
MPPVKNFATLSLDHYDGSTNWAMPVIISETADKVDI